VGPRRLCGSQAVWRDGCTARLVASCDTGLRYRHRCGVPTSGQATGSPGFSVGVMSGSWQGLAAEAHARIVSDVAAAQARVVQARGLREDVERVRGSWTSPQRDLRVVVDGSGRLVDVWFAPSALAGGPERLRAQLLDGVARAGRDGAQQVVRVARARLGEDSPAAAAVASEAEARFGTDPAGQARSIKQALAAAEAAAPWNDPRMGGPAGWWGAGSAEDWRKTTG